MSNSPSLLLRFFNLWLTLFIIWMIANGTLATQTIAAGLVISAGIAFAFATFSKAYSVIHWSPKTLLYYFIYLGVFFIELVKANLNVMALVFSPKIDIKPGIVEIKTQLKTPLGRLALANSITLTPGTLVVDIRDDSLFIHWIDVGSTDPVVAAELISSRFEKYLKVIYG